MEHLQLCLEFSRNTIQVGHMEIAVWDTLVWASLGDQHTEHTSFLLPVTTSNELSTMLKQYCDRDLQSLPSIDLYRVCVPDGDWHGHLVLSNKSILRKRRRLLLWRVLDATSTCHLLCPVHMHKVKHPDKVCFSQGKKFFYDHAIFQEQKYRKEHY